MACGKILRLSTWLKDGRSFVLAIDQIIPRGIAPQLLGDMSRWAHGPWDALVVHPGTIQTFASGFAGGVPLILKLTSNSHDCEDITCRGMIASVEQALSLGANGVAINLFIGSRYEADQMCQVAQVVRECDRWGMPLIIFANPANNSQQFDPYKIAYACRIAAELGADVVKTDYTGDPESFAQVVESCPVPLLAEESPFPETVGGTISTVQGVLSAGASGALLGQRIWGCSDSLGLAHKVSSLIHTAK